MYLLYFPGSFKFFYCLDFPVEHLLLEMETGQHYEGIDDMQDVLGQSEDVLYIFPSNLADGGGIYQFQLGQEHDIIKEIEKYGVDVSKKGQSVAKHLEDVNGVGPALDFAVLFSDYFNIISV